MSLINIRSSVTSSVNKFLKKQDTQDGGAAAATASPKRDEPAQLSTGFICPDCMQSFFTAQGLSVHFEEAHGIKMDDSKPSPKIPKASAKAAVAPSIAKELLELVSIEKKPYTYGFLLLD
ncbi:uncharacterized protein LOC135805695 [Sycon ciliatum]|uniref:uncharacterized protein LOC135805695 n=1 Tax=Sycon ciliatum TaxID=27933 RepID=UPI0031F62DBB